MIGVSFSICCFVFLAIIAFVYFSKKKIKNIDNKIFTSLMIINLLGIFIDIGGFISFRYLGTNNIINICISKIYLIYFITYTFCLMLYIYSLTHNTTKNMRKMIAVFIVICILIMLLPINLHFDGIVGYTDGLSVSLTYFIGFIIISMMCIFIIKAKQKIRKQYIPLFAFIGLMLITIFVQNINPELTLMLFCNSIVTTLMYFTIENPDMKMLEEIKKSKDLAEQSNTEKAMFLYNTSQEIKMPVKGIEEKCEELLNTYDLDEELKEEIRDIKFAAKRLSTTINGVLDMNNSTKNANIEIKTAKYNTKNLFKELVSISKVNMNEAGKKLDFRVNIDDSIPEYLLGDAIRLKQIIITIMNNSIKHTETGFIEFNVSYVIKHDNCRLLITIEDSGIGMEASKLETLFYSTDEEIDEEGLLKANDTKESLSVVKLLTNLIGGTVVVNSELGKGSKFTIVLDQEIAKDEKTTTDIAIESLASNKKILVVDDEEESLKQIVKMLSKYDVNVETALWGQECLERIRKHQQFDLILLDENMPRLNGIKTFEKLKLEENFNTPVIIMVDNSHLEYKDRYLINGFSGILEKPVNKKDIDKVMIKYIKTDE